MALILVSLGQRHPFVSTGALSWIEHGTFITARSKNVHLPHQPLLPGTGQMRLGHGVLEESDRNSSSSRRVADQSSSRPLSQLGTAVAARPSIDGVLSLRCKLVGVSDEFGSLCIDAQPELLTAAGCVVNREFRLEVDNTADEEVVAWARDVQYVTYPFIVPRGTWIAYDHPDGYLVVTISGWTNKASGGAIVELEDFATVGDSLRIISHR